ncbi:SGNH/GDSL hydrolase family protein [Porcipelethomonas sp.]|uniref:SGNH/GDSL hydrolase family protein n=1 Tax=Porcipelethomonas sp. TaxID=2981675 RepID=UPI003EF368B0
MTAVLLCMAVLLAGCGQAKAQVNDAQAAETSSVSVTSETDAIESAETEATSEAATENTSESETMESSENESYTDIEDSEFEIFKENVIVIGDSIALGYGAYERLPMKNVFAQQSVSLTKINDYKFDYAGTEMAPLDIAECIQPENIILSMGLNDIISYSADEFTEMYKEFSDSVLEKSPDSNIYIMGLSPVVSDCSYVKNDKINDYNDSLSEFFKDYNKQIHFVNSAVVLRDSKGFLDNEYSSGDGIHLTGAAYDLMLQELEDYLYK